MLFYLRRKLKKVYICVSLNQKRKVMKIVGVDLEDYIVSIEENGVVFPIYFGNEYCFSFIEEYLQKHAAIMAASLPFWRIETSREPFIMGYENIINRLDLTGKYPNDSIESLKNRVKKEYDEWVSLGVEPQKQGFKLPLFGKRSIIEKYKIPSDVVDSDFYIVKLMNRVHEYMASQREARDSRNL